MEATKKKCVQKNFTCLLVYNIFHIVQTKCIIKRYKVQGIPLPDSDQDAINRSLKYS